tara:strand:- start:11868 stop:12125 length:258 start_codon:yes stop_codon:yes gene_type:complete
MFILVPFWFGLVVVFNFASAIAHVALLNAGVDKPDISATVVRHVIINLTLASAIALFTFGHHTPSCGRACGRFEHPLSSMQRPSV